MLSRKTRQTNKGYTHVDADGLQTVPRLCSRPPRCSPKELSPITDCSQFNSLQASQRSGWLVLLLLTKLQNESLCLYLKYSVMQRDWWRRSRTISGEEAPAARRSCLTIKPSSISSWHSCCFVKTGWRTMQIFMGTTPSLSPVSLVKLSLCPPPPFPGLFL